MKLEHTLTLLVASATTCTASWTRNLSYRSPSEHHPSLGISIPKVVRRTDPTSPWNPSHLNFTHGVASGDPYHDSVILWTRVAPAVDNDRSNITVTGYVPLYDHGTEQYVSVSKSPVCVEFKIAKDKEMHKVADSGKVYTSSDVDYTVKVEAKNLKPFSTYYYQFNVCASKNKSVLGRTKTTPHENDDVSQVRLGVFSCTNYPMGFFNALGNVVRKDSVDYVVHLGDYIYEYPEGEYGYGYSIDRIPQPDREIYTLYDYRRRHAEQREDLDLFASHQQFPWIPTWDDHEIADNTFRDGSAMLNNTEESFIMDGGVSTDQRKMNAVRAYFEWMPIRQVDMDDNLRIWRSFKIGKLVDLMMLDTRNYDRSITDLYYNTDYINAIIDDASRSLMGPRQESWFYRELQESSERGAAWRVVGSQIVFAQINQNTQSEEEKVYNVDAWTGYQANKNRTLHTLLTHNITDTIFLAGDTHGNWVSDISWPSHLPYDPLTGTGSLGVEFAGTAVSSPPPIGENISIALANTQSRALTGVNPELHWSELYYRGYYELVFSDEEVQARYFGSPTVKTRNAWEIGLANFTVKRGEGRLSRPVAGGRVDAGWLKGGKVKGGNVTRDTGSGEWFVSGEGEEAFCGMGWRCDGSDGSGF